jgi:hypothetical protein
MRRSRLGVVLFLALVGSIANDVASDYRLLWRAFVPAWDRFGTQLTDAILDNQEPLANDPHGDPEITTVSACCRYGTSDLRSRSS